MFEPVGSKPALFENIPLREKKIAIGEETLIIPVSVQEAEKELDAFVADRADRGDNTPEIAALGLVSTKSGTTPLKSL